jgi:shikimate kinase
MLEVPSPALGEGKVKGLDIRDIPALHSPPLRESIDLAKVSMNLILTGLRGTGKTSIGRRLAMALRRPFFDTDLLIEQHLGESIPQYVGRLGWEAFRDVEHQVICQVARQQDAVISPGGGALTYARNVEVLKPSGIIIWLAADPIKLAKRLERGHVRPPLTDEPSLQAEVCALSMQREPLYREVCDLVFRVDAETDDEEADFHAKVSTLLGMLRPFLDEK